MNTLLNAPTPQRGATGRARSTEERLRGYMQALSRRRRSLANMTAIYRNQLAIWPVQVQESLRLLADMRTVVLAAQSYLLRLEPHETERLKPWACITKLGNIDALLTELLLTLAMFAPICQDVAQERVQLHLNIRAAYLSLVAVYEDLISMFAALSLKAIQARESEQETGLVSDKDKAQEDAGQ